MKIVAIAILSLLVVPVAVNAETKTFITEATYTMGDGETPSFAEAQVLQRAKQIALEQAGTYVESYTKVQNLDLTTEEIQTLAGGVLRVEVLEQTRTLIGEGLRFSIKLKVAVTTDQMDELSRRIKGKNVTEEYAKLRAEYVKLVQEMERWKQRAAQSSTGPDRETALDQIREREKALTRVYRNEASLFERLLSGPALMEEAQSERAIIDRLMEYIQKEGHVVEIGKVVASRHNSHPDHHTITVPVKVAPGKYLEHRLNEVAEKLNGGGVRPVRWIDGSVPVVYTREQGSVGSNDLFVRASTVRISNSQATEQYFKRQVSGLALLIELDYADPGLASSTCRMPIIANRIITGRGLPPSSFTVYQTDSAKLTLFLDAIVNLSVEFDLESSRAEKLHRVSTRWVSAAEAVPNLCSVIPPISDR